MSGQAGGRGYLVQALISVLDALSEDHKWIAITLEPNNSSEKVDILWSYPDRVKVVQVKSSQNQITKRDVRQWAEDLEASFSAQEYEICLIGSVEHAVFKMNKHGNVAIPKARPLDLGGLREQAAHKLDIYLHSKGFGPRSPKLREMIVDALVGHFSAFATSGTPILREKFDQLLYDWISETVSSSTDSSTDSWQLPLPLSDFVGRTQVIKEIVDRLSGLEKKKTLSTVIWGMGGVGKTATAIQSCWEVRDTFSDGQIIVDLQGMSEKPLTLTDAMLRILAAIDGKPRKQPTKQQILLPEYRRLLSNKKILILLDNARDETQVRALLSVSKSVAFIITSRNALALSDTVAINIDVLPQEDSLSLLRGIVNGKGTDEELHTVARLCGNLPLALRVAGDFLRLHDNWDLPRYINYLKDESRRLERLKSKTTNAGIDIILSTSSHILIQENVILASEWQMLSIFPANFDLTAAAAVWGYIKEKTDRTQMDWTGGKRSFLGECLDTDRAHHQLTALWERSLVQYNKKSQRYRLHDLMKQVARKVFDLMPDHPEAKKSENRLEEATTRYTDYYTCLFAFSSPKFMISIISRVIAEVFFSRAKTDKDDKPPSSIAPATIDRMVNNAAEKVDSIKPEIGKTDNNGLTIDKLEMDNIVQLSLDTHNLKVALDQRGTSARDESQPNLLSSLAIGGFLHYLDGTINLATTNENPPADEEFEMRDRLNRNSEMANAYSRMCKLDAVVSKWAAATLATLKPSVLQEIDSQIAISRSKIAPK